MWVIDEQQKPPRTVPWDPRVVTDRGVADFLMESFGQRGATNPAYQQAILDLTTAVHEAQSGVVSV